MSISWRTALVWTFLFVASLGFERAVGHDLNGHYTNHWAVRVSRGIEHAERLARDLGYEMKGQLVGIPNTYLFKRSDTPSRSKREAAHHTGSLANDEMVEWAEQQIHKRRDKRWIFTGEPLLAFSSRRKNFIDDEPKQFMNDPMWPQQWYLQDTRTSASLPPLDLNVIDAWKKGYTGKNVSVCILDDGLEWNNTDIYPNYDPYASWDTNGNDSDPFPRYDGMGTNKHGTRCAGEVAMVANNSICGVGVAYNAKIGGVRMLDGKVTDSNEAVAVGFNCTHVDIYSASWGPTDNGQTVDGPGRLTREAMERCIREGREGRGVLYIWASGNGGGKHDNCDCDGYINSVFTIAINSVTQSGHSPWYAEMCASTMASTYAGGAYLDQRVSTVDLHNQCTDKHSGTSAAAPIAAAAFAIVLEANPKLTWRDAQHLLVCTAEDGPLLGDNPGWQTNGIGLHYNQRFGYGLINVARMVDAALQWENVPEKITCIVNATKLPSDKLSSKGKIEISFDASSCLNGTQTIIALEHVQVTIDLNYTNRGALEIQLVSPNDTLSQILNTRDQDVSDKGFKNWTFMSIHYWGENPKGIWKLIIADKTEKDYRGVINSVSLMLHGTPTLPGYRKHGSKCGKNRSTKLAQPAVQYKRNQPDPSSNMLSRFFHMMGS